MGHPTLEDVSPIKNGGFPLLCWFTRGYPSEEMIEARSGWMM